MKRLIIENVPGFLHGNNAPREGGVGTIVVDDDATLEALTFLHRRGCQLRAIKAFREVNPPTPTGEVLIRFKTGAR